MADSGLLPREGLPMPEPLPLSDPTFTFGMAPPPKVPSTSGSLPVVPGYVLGELVGRGGMGDVYRARDIEMDREVAVKILQDRYAVGSATAIRPRSQNLFFRNGRPRNLFRNLPLTTTRQRKKCHSDQSFTKGNRSRDRLEFATQR